MLPRQAPFPLAVIAFPGCTLEAILPLIISFKAPFNEIKNEARVFTYQDTAIVTPNSDTPYSPGSYQ